MDFIVTIFLIIITGFMIYKIYKEYKTVDTIDEKVLFWIGVLIVFTPIIIYYVDWYDLPSKFNWFKNDENNRWFEFMSSYISSIYGAIIGAIALVLITIHEFKNLRENDFEQRRINNLPLIEYFVSLHYNFYSDSIVDLSNSGKDTIFVDFGLKNIGMNTIRKCYVNISLSNNDFKIDQQELIKKDDFKHIIFKIPVSKEKNKIKFIIKYQDILFNWYIQEVIVNIDCLKYPENDYYDYEVDALLLIKVNDEKRVENVDLNLK